ncbi:glycerol uptake facilitator-like aquaporin [Microbacteriaceae bacterium MWH-Ta3]|nr:glycerol uptake facilitator-like aquaporin [Microbacteriaceae bacterium MWH-Ta3]
MSTPRLGHRLVSEFVGTGVLSLTIVGTGIQMFALTQSVGITHLSIAVAVGAVLAMVVALGLPISGANFNPVTTLTVALVEGARDYGRIAMYMVAQTLGAIVGVMTANILWDSTLVSFSTSTAEPSLNLLLSEVIATGGLMFLIVVMVARRTPTKLIWVLPAWVIPAVLFTPSGTWANPAITVARFFTDSFTGAPAGFVLPYVAAQVVGGLAVVVVWWVIRRTR